MSEAPEGLLLVDKPGGWTSHDVVARTRRLARTRRVGHAGTLDPMATGVLVLGIERATKLLGHLALTEKEYDATVRLGQTTVTDDAEGEVTASAGAGDLDQGRLREAVAALTGAIEQVPSAVSAIKVGGKRSYARVRAGEDVALAARPVTVRAFDVRAVRPAVAAAEDGSGVDVVDVDVSVTCSSGTYVRALARDLGAALGVGGHLTALRRTRVGPYAIGQCVPLDVLTARVEAGEPLPVLPLPAAVAAAFPRREVSAQEADRVAHGGPLPAIGSGPGPVGVYAQDGRLLALGEESGGRLRYLAVFAPA